MEEAVRFTGLEDHLKKYPKKLSGGLLRRLNIACGIAHRPELILMDEPTVAVDPQSRNHILEGIRKLNEQGSTIIYTSHYMEEVEKICTRISIMDRGRILATGTKEELKAMIGTGETITVETGGMTGEQVEEVRLLPAWCRQTARRESCGCSAPRGGQPDRASAQAGGGGHSLREGLVPAPHAERRVPGDHGKAAQGQKGRGGGIKWEPI